MTGTIEARLQELGVNLPTAASPVANYVPFIKENGVLYISGQLPMGQEGVSYTGQLGDTVSLEEGHKAAELCAINILSQAKAAIGSLDNIVQVVKLVGFVNSTSQFLEHPAVINGASNLMVKVFGDHGKHARSAVGVASLPLNAAVEVEAILKIHEQ